MKKLHIALVVICSGITLSSMAQVSVADIVNGYLEATGGVKNWEAIKGVKMEALIKYQSMEMPMLTYEFDNGVKFQKVKFQGKEVVVMAFDGQTGWKTNFMNLKAEKLDNETVENIKRTSKDFPNPFLHWKEKGYKVTLEGEEEIDGIKTYVLKIDKGTILFNGQEKPNIEYWYFDAENFVPIMSKSHNISEGPMAGKAMERYYSNYDAAGAIYVPYEITTKVDGQVVSSMTIQSFEINPPFDSTMLQMPADTSNLAPQK